MSLPELKLDERGLLTVVVQDYLTAEVRMVAHADREALEKTLAEGLACFWSRSRERLWTKGEESGNLLRVVEVWLDCDADCVLYLVESSGPTCHTGAPTCFFRSLRPEHAPDRALPALGRLEVELRTRAARTAERSYTRTLLDGGPPAIGAKIREEADELARAIADEPVERVVSEMADLLYHAMVGLLARGVSLADVHAELARRFGVSGHDEKASR